MCRRYCRRYSLYYLIVPGALAPQNEHRGGGGSVATKTSFQHASLAVLYISHTIILTTSETSAFS
jgi:hypothetical protein